MHSRSRRGSLGRRARAGFTLVELMMSFGALLVVLLGFTRMLLSSSMASSTNHEAAVAKEAGRSMIEVLQAEEFGEIFARYNADPADDPAGGASPGSGFDVRGLEAVEGDPDGLPGEVLFPTQNGALCETLALPQFGLPADLNADGDDDDENVSAGYRVLPVIVRVEWQGPGGAARVEFRTLIGSY